MPSGPEELDDFAHRGHEGADLGRIVIDIETRTNRTRQPEFPHQRLITMMAATQGETVLIGKRYCVVRVLGSNSGFFLKKRQTEIMRSPPGFFSCAVSLLVLSLAIPVTGQQPAPFSDLIDLRRQRTPPAAEDAPLFAAATRGDLGQVKALCKAGAIVNATTALGDTPASAAAAQGHFDMVAWILDHGFTPAKEYFAPHVYNRPAGQLGDLVLYEAAAAGQTELVAKLINRGVIVARTADRVAPKPLPIAIEHRQLQVIEILLKAGASPKERNSHGKTALELVIAMHNLTMLNLLLDATSDRFSGEELGQGPLETAAESEWKDGVAALLRRGAIPSTIAKPNQEGTPYLPYARNRPIREMILRQILTGGKSAGTETDAGVQLVLAIDRNDNAQFSDGLKTPGAMNFVDTKGWTPLIHALRQKRLAMAQQLIEAGAALDIFTNNGSPPLGFAIETGDLALVDMMLVRGADPNCALKNSPIPMGVAAAQPFPQILQRLIKAGGDPDQVRPRTDDGHFPATPLMTACRRGRLDNVRVLLAAAANVNKVNSGNAGPLHAVMYADSDQVEIVQLLLDHGADPNIADVSGLTPLNVAQQKSKAGSIALLKKHGAIEGALTANFSVASTPVQNAIATGNLALARKLVEHGESVHAVGREKSLPPIIMVLSQAQGKHNSPKEDAEIASFVQFLLDHGANPNARDDARSGEEFFTTPLISAVSAGLPNTIRVLIRGGANPQLINSYFKGPWDMLREINFTPELRSALETALSEIPPKAVQL